MKKKNLDKRKMNKAVRGALLSAGAILLAAILTACGGSGAGGGSSSGTGNCTATGTYSVEWRVSGSYADGVSVATTYFTPSGETEDLGEGAHINPSAGVLLSKTLPACSSAGINVVMLDGSGDSDSVTLTNFTLAIYENGTVKDSVSYDGSYFVDTSGGPTILPPSGALTVIVGQ